MRCRIVGGKRVENGRSTRVVAIKEEGDIDSLFSGGKTTALVGTINGLEDFELISFLVIQDHPQISQSDADWKEQESHRRNSAPSLEPSERRP